MKYIVKKMTEEQQERAISFALDLLDLVNNERVVGHWETFICKGASDILIELVKENMGGCKDD
jgi:hypothetical protein